MKRLLLVLVGLVGMFGMAMSQGLSPQAEVHVATCAPGAPLYSAFGHSAFRIVDPGTQFDRVYNYGTFDFNTPGFYTKFMRGKLPYFLAAAPPRRFLREYIADRRKVTVQILELTPAEVQGVYNYLETNLLPENREYPYDFFFDNCATRERDVLNEVLGKDLNWNPWPEDSLGTLRDLLDLYIEERAWADFGIDVILGLPTDAQADQQLAMFLPDYLALSLDRATVQRNGREQSLVRDRFVWNDPQTPFSFEDGAITPKVVFWGLFALVFLITLLTPATHGLARAFDFLFFLILGLLGLLLLVMWIGTNHQATYANLNMLWAHPLFLIFAFLRLSRKNARQHTFARWAGLWMGLLAIAYLFIPQPFNGAVLPICLAIALRLVDVVRGTFDR